MTPEGPTRFQSTLGNIIFLSRWLQAPLYVGLIIAQAVYVYPFSLELMDASGLPLAR